MCELKNENISYENEKEFFDKNYNISYYDENLPKPSNDLIFMHYISSCVIYGLGALVLFFNPYFKTVAQNFQYSYEVITCAFFAYLLFAPLFLFTIKPKTIYVSHSIEVMNYILKLVKREGLKKNLTSAEIIEWLKPTYKQQQSLILYFVKFFFGPQLTIWSIVHFSQFQIYLNKLFKLISFTQQSGYDFTYVIKSSKLLLNYRDNIYLVLFQLLYFFDCFFFAIGYCTELTFLKNRIRTVESSILGIVFCLACYAPFSNIVTTNFPWKHSEIVMNVTSNPIDFINWVFYAVALVLIILYVSASFALFTKASNMTNRGTCKIFPYNIVRHPAYSTKVGLWWFSSIILVKRLLLNANYEQICLVIFCGIIWTFIYYMRAITEERHLSLDPEYREYTKKVKYKFIPYLW